jgi:hypothetical protein
MAGDRGHLRSMRLLPFAAADVWLSSYAGPAANEYVAPAPDTASDLQ